MLARHLEPVCAIARGIDLAAGATGYDRDSLQAFASDLDIIILCIPPAAIENVLTILGPVLDGKQILADITSVKIRPMQLMEVAYNGPVIGTHPLFGPAGSKDWSICLTPGQNAGEADVELLRHLFTAIGWRPFCSTAEAHDRNIAFVQGLNFVTSLAYFATMDCNGEICHYLTPSFRRRLAATRKMLGEDTALFSWIYDANPRSGQMLEHYQEMLGMIGRGQIDELARLAATWLELDEE